MGDPRSDLTSARERQDWLAAARICEQDLGDLKQAIDCWQKVLEGDDRNVAALDGLERGYTALERWSELVAVLEHRLVAETEREQKLRMLRLLVEISRDQLADDRTAEDAARRLVALTSLVE